MRQPFLRQQGKMVSRSVHKGAFKERHHVVRKDVKSIGGIKEYILEEMIHEQGLQGWLRSHGTRCKKYHRVILTIGIYQVPAKHQAL